MGVKEVLPTFTEINCDGFVEDFPSIKVKDEPMNVFVNNMELESLPLPKDPRAMNQNEFESVVCTNRGISEEIECQDLLIIHDVLTTKTTATTTLTENASDLEKNETLEMDINHSNSKQSHVKCALCDHPLRTASETKNHYRNEHNESAYYKQKTICCKLRLVPGEIYDHIQYHLKPDIYK